MTIKTFYEMLSKLSIRYDNAPIKILHNGVVYAIGPFHSYRGRYCDLAFDRDGQYQYTVQQFRKRLERILRRHVVFRGWKGGEHTYDDRDCIYVTTDLTDYRGMQPASIQIIDHKQPTALIVLKKDDK